MCYFRAAGTFVLGGEVQSQLLTDTLKVFIAGEAEQVAAAFGQRQNRL